MAKRRVTADSEDESVQDASPETKRARTDDGSDVEPSHQRQKSHTKKGKSKARPSHESSDEDEEMEDAKAEDFDEAQFEEQYHDAVEKAVNAKRKVAGGVADHGIIESIEMHQFMCHKYLSFQFGPQINFIIGHNGSGKSAVLSAITIALGGKSNSTGRGSGLKSFIREGQGASEITITLKNQGEEAYKPKEYGSSISITRRFTKEGQSTWKIRGSKDSRTISSKKEELAAICDHMNIQVDNPMNVLTQDAARQFLSASSPQDKYKFFLRGTQLSQLSTEYETCLENITVTMNVLQLKKEALPDLQQAFDEATVKFQEASKARQQKEKVNELKKELAWAHVAKKQRELTEKIEFATSLANRFPKIEEGKQEAKTRFANAEAKIQQLEAELNAMGSLDHLDERREQLKDQIRKNKSVIATCNADVSRIQKDIRECEGTITSFDEQIREETNRLAADTQAKREEHQRKMDEAMHSANAIEVRLTEIEARLPQIGQDLQSFKSDGEAKEQELKTLKRRIEETQGTIGELQRSESNKYAAFGRNMAQVLAKIQSMRWHGDVPLGPLGIHVKVRDQETWADILGQQLSGILTAFAITDARDRDALKQLLDRSENRGNLIIIYEKDLFDYSQGEPDPNMLTVLRALEISDPHVERIFINQRNIERMLLAKTRREAEKMLEYNGGGTAWTADLFNVRRFPDGGGASAPLGSGRPPRSHMLRNEDNVSRKEYYERQLADLEAQYAPLQREFEELRSRYAAARREQTKFEASRKTALQQQNKAKENIRMLQNEANEDLPVNISGLEAAKHDSEKEKDNLISQFAEIQKTKLDHDNANKKLLEEANQVKGQRDEFRGRENAITTEIEAVVAKRLKAQNDIEFYEAKLDKEKKQHEAAEKVVEVLQVEFNDFTVKATEYWHERIETSREPDEIQRIIQSVQTALRERERKQGTTVEEMTIEVNRTKTKLDTAKRDLKQMLALTQILRDSLTARLSRWQEFRRHIALRCKMVFRYNLSQRGYYGNILFNHQDETLSLKVQTDDQLGTQGVSRDKDPRSLSGGEKSFSTICLLLSLWESIGCPLRCLDEFDVFMDAVNRRISMKMMIDTANQSDKKQYILITPQDMNNIHVGPTVRVHRMTDPERGQGTLAMS